MESLQEEWMMDGPRGRCSQASCDLRVLDKRPSNMHGRRQWIYLTLAVLLCGCQASFEAIPTGRWEGQGKWSGYEKNKQGRLERRDGTYTTTVAIAKRNLAGQEMLVATVFSEHPDDSTLGFKRVHVLMTLTKSAKSANGSVLCDTHVQVDIDGPSTLKEPSDDDLEKVLEQDPPPPAKLSRFGWLKTLEVWYEPPDKTGRSPFAEDFIFDGNRLVKKGYYRSKNRTDEIIRWTENLHKVE